MSDTGSEDRASRRSGRDRSGTEESVRRTAGDRNRDRRDSDRDSDNERDRGRKRDDSLDRDLDDGPRRPSNNHLIESRMNKVFDEPSRHARWLSLLKNKLSFGFHHLSPAHLPSMSEDKRAYALCFEKVSNWPMPESVIKAFGKGDYEMTLQLSLSLYHMNSASFFGSTWMGPPISLGNSERSIPKTIDFEYNDIVYMISRITDTSCVAVIEIIVSKFDTVKNLVAAQYGCGWTMIDLFAKPYPIDIAEDRDYNNVTSCAIYSGSPRDLVVHPDIKTLHQHLHEVPECALFLKIYSHRQLLKAQRYLSENETIGRYEHVAGLYPQMVVPIGETRSRPLPCIGSEEVLDAGKQLHTLPGIVKTVTPLTAYITNCQVFVPKREAFELRMIESLYNQYKKVNKSEIRVLSRVLKIGLHNGHAVINGHLFDQALIEDKEDRDMLLTAENNISLPYFVPDAYMSFVLIVEYQLGILASSNNHIDSYSILNNKVNRNKIISITTVGVASYIPCDGKRLILNNTGRGVAEEGVDVEIKLVKDDLCSILNPAHLMLQAGDKQDAMQSYATGNQADNKVKDRLSYIAEENIRSSTQNLRASTASNAAEQLNLKAEVPTNLGAMIGLDLRLTHPSIGKISDGDYVDDLLRQEDTKGKKAIGYPSDDERPEATQRSSKSLKQPTVDLAGSGTFKSKQGFKVTKERFERPSYISDQESVSESIVTGDSDRSHVRLHSLYYGNRRDKGKAEEKDDDNVSMDFKEDSDRPRRFKEPPGQSDLYFHSMHAKLSRPGMEPEDVIVRQRDRDHLLPSEMYAERYIASKTTVPHQRNEFFIRAMTRGAKTRLNRHGISDVIADSADYHMQQENAYKEAYDKGYQSSIMKKPGSIINNYSAMNQRVDLFKEAEDELNINEINVQFVGYRAAKAENSNEVVYLSPRSIYCSFQFYACQPTRTEAMTLLDADKGAVQVLVRDEPTARRDPPLVLRYVIDNSHTSMYESYEFADYLAHKSLYIDVWDSDSLIFLGTAGIPCKLLMRQGTNFVKHAIEVDIINAETSVSSKGGMTSMVVLDNGPLVGERVGSLSLMLSNQGVKGKARIDGKDVFHNRLSSPMEGLNWRAHKDDSPANKATARPKNIVRARPLTETAPELSDALTSLREHVKGVSFRSLGSNRGEGGLSTLNYDEVVILFKRFAGDKKGTVQYNGDLLVLMDLPSMSIMLKKLVKASKAFGDLTAVRKLALRHCNSAEDMNSEDLQEFLRVLFEKTTTKSKPEDRLILANKIIDHVGVDKTHVGVTKLLNYIGEETDRLDWTAVSTRLKLCVQRAVLEGIDIEQTLSDYDIQDTKFISIKHFKEFLNKMSIYGKLSYYDINLAMRIFARHSRGLEDRNPISLQEVLAFLGVDYVGNLQARVKKTVQTDDSINAKYVLRLLNEGQDNVNSAGKFYTYDQVKAVFRSLGLYNVLSHEQIDSLCRKLDVKNNSKLSAEQVLAYLGLTFSASDLSNKPSKDGDKLNIDIPEPDVIIDAEYLLKLLLDKVQSNGVAVDEAFRHFDTNGDGFISPTEFEQGLKQLAIFDHIPNWKGQLSKIVLKFDQSNDGLVSLKEFFTYLGIKDYAPNIVQRLTKIFAVATVSGLSFEDIFTELDENKDGTLDAKEIITGCDKLGTFGNITEADAISVVKIFDDNGDNHISLAEFVSYFKERVAQDLKLRKIKNGVKVAKRFREVMAKAQNKGASVKDIFAHFDKDKGGSVSTTELGQALKSLPNLKALSAEDINDLIAAIDIDNSGDITLDEFEQFINGSQATGGEKVSIFERIRETFAAAEAKGLSFEKAFNVIDKDRNAELSLDEFDMLLRRMPTFRDLDREEVRKVFELIDTDRSGVISLKEFEIFVKEGEKDLKRHKENRQAIDGIDRMGSRGSRGDGSREHSRERKVHSKEDTKELFIRHMRRIAEIDGSLRALFAYLDEDEDGMVRTTQLFNLLRREGVLETMGREEIEDLLSPFMREEEYILVVPLVRFLEGEKVGGLNRGGLVGERRDHDEDREGVLEKEYSFSRDPEVRAVEKKLRSFGRILAKKGVDVESIFHSHDAVRLGHVVRTDFIQILAQLGIYLLEEGKVLREGGAEGAALMKQKEQIRRLQGQSRGEYRSRVPSLARKMFTPEQGGREFKSHLESLTVIDWYRQGQKQMLLQRVLSHSLAHTIHLYPRFGKTLYFEYPLTNPFSHEERFEIEINDPELRLVSLYEEWHHLRRHCTPCVGEVGKEVEEGEVFDRDGLGKVGVCLLPHETFSIPFTFMTLLPTLPTLSTRVARREESKGEEKESEEEADRVVEVKIISGSHGHIVSILRIYLHRRHLIVNRVIRFQETENSIAKRQLKLISTKEEHVGNYNKQFKYIHCVESAPTTTLSPQENSRVVVEWGGGVGGYEDDSQAMTILIRYRCAAAPTAGTFYLLIYNDPYQASLYEIWQIVVQSRMRLDVQSMLRSASAADLVLRGDNYSRRVRAFSSQSNAYSITFKPEHIFQLVPGAYNRVLTTVQPRLLGNRKALINVVDVDSRELVSSWLLNITSTSPAVSRAYDVVVTQKALFKKILFKNPWDIHRKFVLLSSDEDVMRPRVPVVEVAPHSSAYLRLWFAPWSGSEAVKEVHLFLNDAVEGQNEECHLFRIRSAGHS